MSKRSLQNDLTSQNGTLMTFGHVYQIQNTSLQGWKPLVFFFSVTPLLLVAVRAILWQPHKKQVCLCMQEFATLHAKHVDWHYLTICLSFQASLGRTCAYQSLLVWRRDTPRTSPHMQTCQDQPKMWNSLKLAFWCFVCCRNIPSCSEMLVVWTFICFI